VIVALAGQRHGILFLFLLSESIGRVAGLSTALAPASTVGGVTGPGPDGTGGTAGATAGGGVFAEAVDGGADGEGGSLQAATKRTQTVPDIQLRWQTPTTLSSRLGRIAHIIDFARQAARRVIRQRRKPV
jgi:hypothetical protein